MKIKDLVITSVIDSVSINGIEYIQGFDTNDDASVFCFRDAREEILMVVDCHGTVFNKNDKTIGRFRLIDEKWVFEYNNYLKSSAVPESIVTDFTINQPDGLLWAEMFVFKIFIDHGLL